ncbi:thermostable hemolysin [Vibrio quintilis]|uniref:Thermostable hemolysin n=1 Tax=Vibrio quintilis TaxID=1117707 RepID=A0A1M7YWF3_9VIBR|nr:thermostable hemolysin [Vibrio quintilis]SHO57009.1 Thermostable hemolysin [Vibrio quintilis]
MSVALNHASVRLTVIEPHHALRQRAEQYVVDRYASAFDAQIEAFMPVFLALVQQDEIQSVCGYRAAAEDTLFLEQYLDYPAEQLISEHFSQPVSRESLIEFGQLAAFSKGFSPLHFYLITRHLAALNYQWCICTVTDPLFALMKRMGLNPVVIAQADPARVENAHLWGRYYQTQPRIVAGNIRQGLQYLQQYMSLRTGQE